MRIQELSEELVDQTIKEVNKLYSLIKRYKSFKNTYYGKSRNHSKKIK
jgi:hypothetical protein